jgi:hypothetical protein
MVYTSVFTEKYTGTLKSRRITGTHNLTAFCCRLFFALGTAPDPYVAVNMMKKLLQRKRRLFYNPFMLL